MSDDFKGGEMKNYKKAAKSKDFAAFMVDPKGFEPSVSALRTRRFTS